MNLVSMALAYIAKHSRNLEADAIAHLKAFAAHAEATLSKAVDTVETDATGLLSDAESKVEAVELAVEEVEAHAKGSFAHLLQAQTPESDPQ